MSEMINERQKVFSEHTSEHAQYCALFPEDDPLTVAFLMLLTETTMLRREVGTVIERLQAVERNTWRA